MGSKAYTPAQKAEAVALATVIGAEAAADQLGMDARTIRKWAGAAGKAPADAIAPASWQSLMDVALARTQAAVASGKLPAVKVATIAAIAKRNAERPRDADGEPSAVSARDAFFEWLWDAAMTPEDLGLTDEAQIDPHLEAYGDAVDELMGPGLIVLANAELPADRGPHNPEGSHRVALLAWRSGNADIPAGDILEWAQEQTKAILAEHGSLISWHRWREAMEARERVITDRARVLWRDGGMRLHEAEAFARDHLADDLPIPEPGAFT